MAPLVERERERERENTSKMVKKCGERYNERGC